MKRVPAGALLLLALAAGIALRLPNLAKRPMHGDEAIQAVKTWELRETGKAPYDPNLYHGPALAYANLPLLLLKGRKSFAETGELDYRLIPVLFGVAVILLAWLMRDGIGTGGAALATVLTALSPALAYFSRYYIQETLLVFFTGLTIACGWRYTREAKRVWLYAGAGAAGLMLATKETAFIAFAAMLGALVLARPRLPPLKAYAGPAAAALGLAALLFSSFLTRPAGIVDALVAPLIYLKLGVGGGVHDHPWHYYLGMLLFSHLERGSLFSEAVIVLPGAAGIVWGWRNGGLARFLAAYTLLMIAIYSLIPYKTPWCMLSFLHGLALLAGFSLSRALGLIRAVPGRMAAAAVLTAALGHLGWQAYRANFVFPSDRRNPYVYAHPVPDVKNMADTVERLSRFHPDGKDMLVRVIGSDCWPLPWYLRGMGRVGYWPGLPEAPDAPVIIAPLTVSDKLARRLEGDYTAQFFGLRPDVILALRAATGLWEKSLGTTPSAD